MPEPIIIRKSALAAFKDNKVLMARNKKNPVVFYNLGGTVEPGEDDLTCLRREVLEEAGVYLIHGSEKFLNEFRGSAYGKDNTEVHIKLYTGELDGQPTPKSEVAELQYLDSSVDPARMTPLGIEIFDWLKAHGLIN